MDVRHSDVNQVITKENPRRKRGSSKTRLPSRESEEAQHRQHASKPDENASKLKRYPSFSKITCKIPSHVVKPKPAIPDIPKIYAKYPSFDYVTHKIDDKNLAERPVANRLQQTSVRLPSYSHVQSTIAKLVSNNAGKKIIARKKNLERENNDVEKNAKQTTVEDWLSSSGSFDEEVLEERTPNNVNVRGPEMKIDDDAEKSRQSIIVNNKIHVVKVGKKRNSISSEMRRKRLEDISIRLQRLVDVSKNGGSKKASNQELPESTAIENVHAGMRTEDDDDDAGKNRSAKNKRDVVVKVRKKRNPISSETRRKRFKRVSKSGGGGSKKTFNEVLLGSENVPARKSRPTMVKNKRDVDKLRKKRKPIVSNVQKKRLKEVFKSGSKLLTIPFPFLKS